jgi:hypothetical protein
MKKNISICLVFLVAAVLIVLPVNSSVKQFSSNRAVGTSVAVLSGSPLPMPTPPGSAAVRLSGSPLPMPTPPGVTVLRASGSPLPMPTPPGILA